MIIKKQDLCVSEPKDLANHWTDKNILYRVASHRYWEGGRSWYPPFLKGHQRPLETYSLVITYINILKNCWQCNSEVVYLWISRTVGKEKSIILFRIKLRVPGNNINSGTTLSQTAYLNEQCLSVFIFEKSMQLEDF